MYEVIAQEEEKIEILFTGDLNREDFRQVIHQLESLAAMYQDIDVLFDASGLKKYEFSIVLEEMDFYKKYKNHLRRVAIVADTGFPDFIVNLFNKFTETDFRVFHTAEIENARKWIFPSPLPS